MESDGRGGTRGGTSYKSVQEDFDVVTDCENNLFDFFFSVFMNYFDNPGGMIPAWLVNWTAKVMMNHCVSHHALLERLPCHVSECQSKKKKKKKIGVDQICNILRG